MDKLHIYKKHNICMSQNSFFWQSIIRLVNAKSMNWHFFYLNNILTAFALGAIDSIEHSESKSNRNVVIRGFLGLTQHRNRWFLNSRMCPLVPFVGMFAIKLSSHWELRASRSAFCDISCVSSSRIRPRSFNVHVSIHSITRTTIPGTYRGPVGHGIA